MNMPQYQQFQKCFISRPEINITQTRENVWKKNAVYVELNLRKPLSNKFLEFENLYFWFGLLLLSESSSQGKDWRWDSGYQFEDPELPVTLLSTASIHFWCFSPWVFRTRVLSQGVSKESCEPKVNFGSTWKLCVEKPRKSVVEWHHHQGYDENLRHQRNSLPCSLHNHKRLQCSSICRNNVTLFCHLHNW